MTSTKSKIGVADAVKVTGEVVALVSPFGGPPDLQGDVIDSHAYDADIKYWNASPNRLPVLISHSWADETANIGHVEKLEAVMGYGLVATMKLDLSNPRAAYIHKLLSERRMVEFSIGYDSYQEKIQYDGSTLLQRLHIIEVSVCLKGAAGTLGEPDGRTQLLSVKSAEVEKENNDPRYWQRAVEAAAAGHKFSPAIFEAEERQAERNRPVVSNEVLDGDTITSLTSWNAEPDPAEGESFRVEFPIVVE
jgi:HK97 family phage prohead protease